MGRPYVIPCIYCMFFQKYQKEGAKESKYLCVVLLKPIGYIESVYGSTRISRCFLYEVSWMCHCGGECHVLGVLVLIGDSTRVGYYLDAFASSCLLSHKVDFCQYFGNLDQNCILFRIREGFLLQWVIACWLPLANGPILKYLLSWVPSYIWISSQNSSSALFRAGSVSPLGRGIPIRQLLGPLGVFCLVVLHF